MIWIKKVPQDPYFKNFIILSRPIVSFHFFPVSFSFHKSEDCDFKSIDYLWCVNAISDRIMTKCCVVNCNKLFFSRGPL